MPGSQKAANSYPLLIKSYIRVSRKSKVTLLECACFTAEKHIGGEVGGRELQKHKEKHEGWIILTVRKQYK